MGVQLLQNYVCHMLANCVAAHSSSLWQRKGWSKVESEELKEPPIMDINSYIEASLDMLYAHLSDPILWT